MTDATLFSIETSMHGRMRVKFHGPDLDESDVERLTGLLGRVATFMELHGWVTLAEIADACKGSEASVSARLRDLRKHGWTVERRKTEQRGIFQYRGRKA